MRDTKCVKRKTTVKCDLCKSTMKSKKGYRTFDVWGINVDICTKCYNNIPEGIRVNEIFKIILSGFLSTDISRNQLKDLSNPDNMWLLVSTPEDGIELYTVENVEEMEELVKDIFDEDDDYWGLIKGNVYDIDTRMDVVVTIKMEKIEGKE